jgi:quinol monooxygenase YgiN
MPMKALYVTLKAQSGKEDRVARFLKDGAEIVEAEPATVAWFAIQLDSETFAIFDVFPDEAGREAHLNGQLASALMAKASELLAESPDLKKADVVAAKLPHLRTIVTTVGNEELIPLQVGSELRIRNTGEIVIGNPEIELALDRRAADAVLAYHYDKVAGEHVLRLLEPVANRRHLPHHRPND